LHPQNSREFSPVLIPGSAAFVPSGTNKKDNVIAGDLSFVAAFMEFGIK
jgi:hypothetical protein